jgi:hypothetical protein
MRETLYHIGRNKNSNEIYVFNETVSSSHAQIIIDENGDLIIIDLSSKNGVLVNGKKIVSPVKLVKNDVISIGDFNCTQSDLINAIKVFDFKNQQPFERSVPLKSSLQKEYIKPKKINKMKKKSVFITLIILGLVVVVLGATLVSDQKEKQNKFKNKNNTENINDESNATSNTNDESSTSSTVIEFKKQRTDVTYNFGCLASAGDGRSNEAIFKFGEFTRNAQNTVLNEVKVSLQEEKEAGDALVKYYKEKYNFKNTGSDYFKLDRIMKDLVKRLADPRGVEYEMHFIDDTIMNVFTLGGHIIVFKGMYDFCETDSEIASIISHEIAHNELGHSTLALKKQKAASSWGIFGQIALTMENMVTTSFNQKQETEADLFGMDIMYPTGYKSCDVINLWKRMNEFENEFNLAENFSRTHPYSRNRANCIEHHLESNYNKKCSN